MRGRVESAYGESAYGVSELLANMMTAYARARMPNRGTFEPSFST